MLIDLVTLQNTLFISQKKEAVGLTEADTAEMHYSEKNVLH